MSIEYIRQLAEEAGVYAEGMGKKPWVYHPSNTVEAPFPFPNLGDYVPEGWELVERHFVDSSGFGQPGEPALTAPEFARIVEERNDRYGDQVGWGVVEVGQFQVYVGEFHRKDQS